VRNPSLVGGLVLVAMVLGGCAKEAPYGTASQEAIRAYDKGMDDFGKFYYADALKAFEQATQADSGFAIAWARIAQIYFRTDNRGEASSAIARAIEYSDRATPREGLYIRLLSHFVSYEFDSAAATADTLIREYPEDKEAYLQRGYLFEYDRNYERAIQMYQRAADLDTGCAQAYMSLGYAYSSIGEQEKALAYMKRYIRLAPQAGDPRASYADLLVRVGRYKEALDQYQKSLEIKPDYWYSMLQIARVYATMGKLRESDVYMQKAINLLPPTVNREVMTLTTHAGYDMNRGKYQEAADQYISALTIDSLNGSAAYGYCGALVRLRPYVYRQIAEIDLRSKDFESALTACEEALALNPNEPLMLLTLTRVYQAMGDARMTREIGSRLSAFWADADSDFVRLKELRRILGRVAAA
jgi:tetratricopeptide (TPR) repeat protein